LNPPLFFASRRSTPSNTRRAFLSHPAWSGALRLRPQSDKVRTGVSRVLGRGPLRHHAFFGD
jgi:hypothetical protein